MVSSWQLSLSSSLPFIIAVKVSSSQLCAFLLCITLMCILNASLHLRMVKESASAGVYLCINFWLPGAASLVSQPYCLQYVCRI